MRCILAVLVSYTARCEKKKKKKKGTVRPSRGSDWNVPGWMDGWVDGWSVSESHCPEMMDQRSSRRIGAVRCTNLGPHLQMRHRLLDLGAGEGSAEVSRLEFTHYAGRISPRAGVPRAGFCRSDGIGPLQAPLISQCQRSWIVITNELSFPRLRSTLSCS